MPMRLSLLDLFAWATVATVATGAVALGVAVSRQGSEPAVRPTLLATNGGHQGSSTAPVGPIEREVESMRAVSLSAATELAATQRR